MTVGWKIGIGILLVLVAGWWLVGTRLTPPESLPSDAETVIPVVTEPGEAADLAAPSEAGAVLQQPGTFSGQVDGATNLQGAATFTPEELNNITIE